VSSRDVPRVELPPPEADQPAWGKVGVIAILGFVIGVAWPRLAGISLGPNPPADAPRAAPTTSTASAGPAKTGLSAVAAVDAPVPGSSALLGSEPGGGNEQGVTVGAAEIAKCRDQKGKSTESCDKIPVDTVLGARLKELARCPSALGLSGKVQIGFDLDFKNKTLKVQRAKAKLPRTTLDGLTRCVEKTFGGVSLDEIAHENSRYTVNYDVSFHPPGRPAEGEGAGGAGDADKGTPLDGKTAKIGWGSCQVRETPKNGTVVGKLSRHAEVKLLEKKEDWYRVEYGDKKQGWIFSGALAQ